ncbi:acyltransferase family protein [Pseudoxanthomonas mexicana]
MRGIALLFGVIVHASMSWLPGAQYFWLTHDASPSEFAGLVFYVPHMFRMLLFFLLAGFFARMSLQRLGAKGFIRDRARRIGMPLLVGWGPMLAAILAVGAWAAWVANNGQLPPPPETPPLSPLRFPLPHLIHGSCTCCCFAMQRPWHCAARGSATAVPCGVRWIPVCGMLASPIGPLLLALPLGAAWSAHAQWYAWFGDSYARPVAVSQPGRVRRVRQRLRVRLAAAAATGPAAALGHTLAAAPGNRGAGHHRMPVACRASAPRLVPATQDIETLAYAVAYAIAGWSWTFALVGLGLRFLFRAQPVAPLPGRCLRTGSYLVHLPLVMALQVAMSRVQWPWFVEFALVLAVAMALLLASYDLLVRTASLVLGSTGGARRAGWIVAEVLPEIGVTSVIGLGGVG